jgi:hypothetical protein
MDCLKEDLHAQPRITGDTQAEGLQFDIAYHVVTAAEMVAGVVGACGLVGLRVKT